MNQISTLVINCGSSSLKFAVIEPTSGQTLLSGLAERLGSSQAIVKFEYEEKKESRTPNATDHNGALATVSQILDETGLLSGITGVGHRVVHGGELFSESMLLDDNKIEKLETLNHLAPLHNPVNLLGIHALKDLLPNLPQVAVFDTAFHQSMPEAAFLYGLPYDLYKQHGVRRYGFHGTSYRYVNQKAAELLQLPSDDCHFLAAHLGNGCSAAAIHAGQSVDSSMGLTPLEGLIMGTRSGDIDPGMVEFLGKRLNISLTETMAILNKQSGLLGLSGVSNDMREIQHAAEQGNEQANLALEVFAFRIARYLGSLAISLPKISALIFTGGIGENDRLTRSMVIDHLSLLGFKLDGALNQSNGDKIGRITTEDSTLAMVVKTNEELMIAQDTQRLIQSV